MSDYRTGWHFLPALARLGLEAVVIGQQLLRERDALREVARAADGALCAHPNIVTGTDLNRAAPCGACWACRLRAAVDALPDDVREGLEAAANE